MEPENLDSDINKLNILSRIRSDLASHADEKTINNYSRFFKEEVMFYGVKSGIVSKLAKDYFKELKETNYLEKAGKNKDTDKIKVEIKGKIKGKTKEKINDKNNKADKEEVFALCEELFKSDYCEEAFIAADWIYELRNDYSEPDFFVFERWIEKYINNWAKCDTFCNHSVASFIEKFPAYIENLKSWTASENRWVRRASAVTLVLPARKGNFLQDLFEISDLLLKDRDDLVQKGYGWMLKEASKAHQQEVFDYVMKNKKEMPRTALRYAIEKMPADLRAKAMEK